MERIKTNGDKIRSHFTFFSDFIKTREFKGLKIKGITANAATKLIRLVKWFVGKGHHSGYSAIELIVEPGPVKKELCIDEK